MFSSQNFWISTSLTVAFARIASEVCGKFNDSSYKVSSGLHGVGASVVTALSEYLDVVSCNDGIMVHQRFEKGGKIIHKQENLGKTNKTGTTVTFKPDPKIFDTVIFDRKIIENSTL